MGLREMISDNKQGAMSAGAMLLLVAAGSLAYQVFYAAKPPMDATPVYAFYTADGGKTWFRDRADRVTPFSTGDGQEAVTARVFQCPHGQFVGYLERTSADGKAEVERVIKHAERTPPGMAGKDGKGPWPPNVMPVLTSMTEVCPPGNPPSGWVDRNSEAAARVMEIHCPHDATKPAAYVNADEK